MTIAVIYVALVLVTGLAAGLAEHFGWIKSERLRRIVRKAYGLDRPDRRQRRDQRDDGN